MFRAPCLPAQVGSASDSTSLVVAGTNPAAEAVPIPGDISLGDLEKVLRLNERLRDQNKQLRKENQQLLGENAMLRQLEKET